MRALLDEIADILERGSGLDEQSRVDTRREARLLVAGVLDCAPGDVSQRDVRALPHTQRDRIRSVAIRRARGEPLAYCVGAAAFRHLVLAVDARVLIPRPETEILVDEALRVAAARPGGIAVDIGTGSGAIALALASEGRFDGVIATDLSADALDVARANATRLPPGSAPVEFRAGMDLGPIEGVLARVIVSNPPYISFDEATALPASVRNWEPATALFAANGGMARYDALFSGAARCLEPGGWLVLEVGDHQASATAAVVAGLGYDVVETTPDLTGRDRVVEGRRV